MLTTTATSTTQQQQALNIEASNTSQPLKRPRGVENDKDTSTISASKRLKPCHLDAIAPSKALATTSNIEATEISSTQKREAAPQGSKRTNKVEAVVHLSKLANGILPKRKSEPKCRRKSSSRSKKKLSASNASSHSSVTAVCCLCHKKDSELNLGFLFGPYKRATDNLPENNSGNIWIHEGCAVWTPGVCLVGAQLIGLQEAVSEAEKLVCKQHLLLIM